MKRGKGLKGWTFHRGQGKKEFLARGAGLFLGPPPQASVYIMAVYLPQHSIFPGSIRFSIIVGNSI